MRSVGGLSWIEDVAMRNASSRRLKMASAERARKGLPEYEGVPYCPRRPGFPAVGEAAHQLEASSFTAERVGMKTIASRRTINGRGSAFVQPYQRAE